MVQYAIAGLPVEPINHHEVFEDDSTQRDDTLPG